MVPWVAVGTAVAEELLSIREGLVAFQDMLCVLRAYSQTAAGGHLCHNKWILFSESFSDLFFTCSFRRRTLAAASV